MKRRTYITLLVIAIMICLLPVSALSAQAAANDTLPLKGKTISVMGDSISTYAGWSDVDPIINEPGTVSNGRLGEAYYGPEGEDFHNTDMSVTDTWWHQAAEQLGAEVLVNNSSNSTGLFFASHSNADWDAYLKARLMYKDRPYYLGKDGKTPDIIALYVGSNEVRNNKLPQKLGSVDDVDFDALIAKNTDGTYTYAEPETVAEAYCILLHKVSVTYPDAEIYCFKVVPGAGGNLSVFNGNGRLPYAKLFNDMVDDVAEHYGAIVVDLLTAFELDPDNDGQATEEAFNTFQTYYHNDPHPNAKGFDVITECFVNTVLENSKYVTEVETEAASSELIGLEVTENDNEITRSAKDFITGNGLLVNYNSLFRINGDTSYFEEKYTSENGDGTYKAEGGATEEVVAKAPAVTLELPLISKSEDAVPVTSTEKGRETAHLETTGDDDTSDGIYDYVTKNIIRQGVASVKVMPIELNKHTGSVNFSEADYIKGKVQPAEGNDILRGTKSEVTAPEVIDISEGYDYKFLGSDTYSRFYSAHAHHSKSASYPDEPPVYTDSKRSVYVHADHNIFVQRNLVAPKLFFEDGIIETGAPFPLRWDSVQQFVLCDRAGNLITSYCADKDTNTQEGFDYRLYNLEDATYYTEEEAKMIRTVAQNGYWGTESGFGSLASVKEMMRNAPAGTFTEADINNITDGMALTATQYAIWTYSNAMNRVEFLNCYYANKNLGVGKIADQEEVERVFKLYHYLTSLEPVASLEMKTTRKMIINENNFLENVSIKIKGKPEEDPCNRDNDTENDVYLTDIKFKLGVKPNANDDLVLKIMSGETPVATGRITGVADPKERATEVQLTADEYGYYTFEDIVLQEGTSDNLCFYLEGEQELEKAAQLLLSEEDLVEGEMTDSQPMVAVMSGRRDVDVRVDINFKLDVTDEQVSEKHVWRTEKYIDPPADPEDPEDNATQTGDDSNMMIWFVLMALAAVTGIVVYRKRENA